MLSDLPFSSLADWGDYATREPWGAPAWDARIGYMLAVLVNALTGAATRPADYTPRWDGAGQSRADVVPQSGDHVRAVLQEWGKAVNAHHRKD